MLYAGLVVFLLSAILILSNLLGQHHKDRATDLPYEGGIQQTGSARLRFSAQFYLVAMLFVIFDVEAVYLYAWAVAVPETGLLGFVEVTIFVAILLASLAYLWLTGALDWHAQSERPSLRHRRKPSMPESKEFYDDQVA